MVCSMLPYLAIQYFQYHELYYLYSRSLFSLYFFFLLRLNFSSESSVPSSYLPSPTRARILYHFTKVPPTFTTPQSSFDPCQLPFLCKLNS